MKFYWMKFPSGTPHNEMVAVMALSAGLNSSRTFGICLHPWGIRVMLGWRDFLFVWGW
jgi:hypothetical protein